MKSHQFQSITEEQWRSGKSRQRCAECSRDYGDPIHCASSISSNYPLVVVIEDCFIPEWAGKIVELSRDTSTETNYAVLHALAALAEVGLRRERLN